MGTLFFCVFYFFMFLFFFVFVFVFMLIWFIYLAYVCFLLAVDCAGTAQSHADDVDFRGGSVIGCGVAS